MMWTEATNKQEDGGELCDDRILEMQRAERRGDREGALADLVDGMTSRAIEANKSETSSF
jgi:hypothetical protein